VCMLGGSIEFKGGSIARTTSKAVRDPLAAHCASCLLLGMCEMSCMTGVACFIMRMAWRMLHASCCALRAAC
jgi:hypothetical protein